MRHHLWLPLVVSAAHVAPHGTLPLTSAAHVAPHATLPLTRAVHVAPHATLPLTRAVHVAPRATLPMASISEQPVEKNSVLDSVGCGLSWIYLAHFASLYTQLPGLYGSGGLTPITLPAARAAIDDTWLLHAIPNPELGLESFCFLGMAVAFLQVSMPQSRRGLAGMATFSLLCLLWHDLLYSGGLFMGYQMDALLLDATPIAILAASGLSPGAATFGYRWLLARLYIGAGAVKLLSCDASWRDLSAVHWHVQSQPLPNPLAPAAFALPASVGQLATIAVLVIELAAPFLFLAPSPRLRAVAFGLHTSLMAAIMLPGNFGPLQLLLIVIGLSLLDDEDFSAMGSTWDSMREPPSPMVIASSEDASTRAPTRAGWLLSAASVLLALAATCWVVHDVSTSCADTWRAAPLVYAALAYASCALLSGTAAGSAPADVGVGLLLLAGSSVPLAASVDVELPDLAYNLEAISLGAQEYGLFAIITGVGGRPVEVIEAAYEMEGPWRYVPLRYQVNDPAAPLPLCVPHFPRMDWTLWFVPLGQGGRWVGRLLHGITNAEPSVLSLLDRPAFEAAFPLGPPEFVRISSQDYSVHGAVDAGAEVAAATWRVLEGSSDFEVFARADLERFRPQDGASAWPTLPLLRAMAAASGDGERFVWGVCAVAEATRRGVATRAP